MKHLLRHRWTLTIVFLTIFAISGCGGQKSDNAGSNSGGGEPTSTTTASPGTETSGTGTSSSSGTSGTTPTKTVPPEAQKLGVAPQGDTTCPKNAPIKGVVTAKRGNIYRGPKSPDYAKVKPKICFADVATAEKAGFKAPK